MLLWMSCLTVLGVAIGGVALWLNAEDPLPELRTVNVEHRDFRIVVSATGTVEPKRIYQVGPDVSGSIEKFGNDPDKPEKWIGIGTRVSKGTVLFQIDREPYEIALQRAQTAHRKAQANLVRLEILMEQAERDMQLAERLRATNAQRDYEKIVTATRLAASQLEIGRVELDQVFSELGNAEKELAKTNIRSPIDGVVIDRRANVGQHVRAGQPGLFLVATTLDEMRIRASVSESDIGKIKVGQPVTFTVDAYRDKRLTGKVQKILMNARMHGNFVTYDVMVAVDKADSDLFPHMTANVEFEIVSRENAWLVPNAAVGWQPAQGQIAPQHAPAAKTDTALIWVPTGHGKVRPIPVRTGIDDGVVTVVEGEGFTEGMPVVVGEIKITRLARIIPSAKTIR